MGKKLEKIKLSDLIKMFGVPADLAHIEGAFKCTTHPNKRNEFYDGIAALIRNPKYDPNQLLEMFDKNEGLFDKEIFLFRMATLLKQDINDENTRKLLGPNAEKKRPNMVFIVGHNHPKESALENAKRYLKDIDVALLVQNVSTEKVRIELSQEFAGNTNFIAKRNAQIDEKMQQIDEILGLDNVLKFIDPSELPNICYYDNVGAYLSSILPKYKMEDCPELDELSKKRLASATTPLRSIYKIEEFKKLIQDNRHYLDMDQFLLYAAVTYSNLYKNNPEKCSYEEAQKYKDFIDNVEKLLENPRAKIHYQDAKESISYIDLKNQASKFLNHFVGGKYHTDIQLQMLSQGMLAGEIDVSTITPYELQNVFKFSDKQLQEIVFANPDSLSYLIDNGLLSNDKISEVLSYIDGIISSNQLLTLIQTQNIDKNGILELYLKGNIEFETITNLPKDLNQPEYCLEFASEEKLVEFYTAENRDEDELERYIKLYKTIKIDGKTLEEQKEIAESILNQSFDLLEEDKVFDLYHRGLVPLDTVVDFLGEHVIIQMYKSGELKPVDAKRLYEQGEITLDAIREILQSEDLEDTQKLVLIYSTFPAPEDEETRNELIDYIGNLTNTIHEPGGGRRGPKRPGENFQNKFVTDPCARWNLMAQIDSEYSQQFLKDGHIIFYLPNEGKFIIERLYKANKQFAYGDATYILNADLFREKKDEIIANSKVNRTSLIKIAKENSTNRTNESLDSQEKEPNVGKNKGAKKIIHTGWANEMVKYFQLEDESKYTKEQIEEIRKLVKAVEDSRKPLER